MGRAIAHFFLGEASKGKLSLNFNYKVSKGAKIRKRYNQVPHLTQDTNGKVTNSQLDTTNERAKSVLKIFIPNSVSILTKKDIKHIKQDFHSVAWVMP